MLKDRSLIEGELKKSITLQGFNRKNLKIINDELDKYNVPKGTYNKIASNTDIYIPTLDLKIIILITKALFLVTKDAAINPVDYFTKREIEEAENYSPQEVGVGTISLPYTFYPVIKVGPFDYSTKISGIDLVKFSPLIEYDFETQRSPKYRRDESLDTIIEEADINQNSVEEIAEYIKQDDYLPDTIVLNVYSEEVEPFSYNESGFTMTINKGARITILDGFHRLKGNQLAYVLNKNINVVFMLAIKSYDKNQARRYFGRINKVNPVKKGRIDELLQERSSDKIVNFLQNNCSEFKGKIASTSNIVRIMGHYTTTEILSSAIHDAFGIVNYAEQVKISKYMSECFNFILSFYQDEFKNQSTNKSINKRDNYITHPLMFMAFVCIIKQMYDDGENPESVNDIIEKIDLNNEKIENILVPNKKNFRANKNKEIIARAREGLFKYVNEKYLEVISNVK